MSSDNTPESVTDKLNLETAVVAWAEIERFFAKGQLYIVEQQQDLISTAARVSNDDKSFIEQQLNNKQLFLPTIDWVKQNCQTDTPFWAVVVAPFVFAQKK
ncbi:DUF2288 family protein [Pleionea mediterranea]|jgi:hypothetical protein|uniref:DUF2288 family protein n=1 Tax=Pleionea mediterranea TaxID=523701 RepID=A0A316FKK1_9GAMM|nr:DUF2288 family protein [Pleionea mediterranea]PWK49234.1 hypothetical protein C8D97_108144 [Pleionea mediterranea]